MKKLISLVLVALLIFSLSVSAMAAEIDFTPDQLPAYDSEAYPYISVYDYSDFGVYCAFVESKPSYYRADGYTYYKAGASFIQFEKKSTGWVQIAQDTFSKDGRFEDQSLHPVVWSNYDILNADDGSVYFGNSDLGFCDGSSCPANDVDHDGICDDCGLRLMNLVRTPTPPIHDGNNKHSVMFYTGDTYYYTVYTSDSAYSIRGYNYGTRMRSTSDIVVYVTRYMSYDGLNWSAEYSDRAMDYYPGEQGWTLLSSTFNWYDSSENTSDPFFPVPLWAEVEKVTQGEMEVTQAKTTETMVYLMVCGIGCLALLIVLSLFGKRSLIYRG